MVPIQICGKNAGSIGYGLMGLTLVPRKEEEMITILKTALNNGCNVWDGGQFYGPPERNSLTLLRAYFEKYPEDADKVIINIKAGTKIGKLEPEGRAEPLTQNVFACIDQLGPRGKIDMFEMARRDLDVSIEEQIGTLHELAEQGQIGSVALSEVNANTIREAAKITRISAVEIELSLFSTEPMTNGILAACHELDIPVLAYSPVGRGFLTGQIRSLDDLAADDHRRHSPRFSPENFAHNFKLVAEVERIARRKGCTCSQLAINWVRSLSGRPGFPTIIPIPGASSVERVLENSKVVELDEEDLKEIETILSEFTPEGDRYPAMFQKWSNA